MNLVVLLGNLTRDPETRTTPNGANLTEFGLAVNRVYKDSNGNKQTAVMFVDVVAWGKQAESVAKFFTKGKPIVVQGSLELDTWETPEGTKRSKHKIRMDSFNFVPGSGDRSKGNSGGDEPVAVEVGADGDSGDIPF